uniref:Uncharacterized protein n=1 Tax=Panagrolaimus superbus TaxID=310955 RepID=A0A914YLL1_9BILA
MLCYVSLKLNICAAPYPTDFIKRISQFRLPNDSPSSLKKTFEKKCQRKIIKKPEYEFVEVFQNGMKKTRLIIYTGENKKFCYEYFWDQHKNRYHCCGCIRKSVRAAIYNINEENEYVMLINNNHICQPREYDSLKLFERQKIVRKPDFEIQTILKNGTEKRTLVVFVPENRKMCHKYLSRNFSQQHFYCSRCHNKRHSVIARLCQDDDESEQYIVLGEEAHICDPKPYVSANSSQDIIVDSNDLIFISKTNGQSRIFVFNPKNRNMGYEFSETKNNFYMCLGCHQKRKSVIAKLCQKDNGEFYIRMGPNQKHACQFRKYLLEKLEENLIYPPNFMFYSKKTKRPHLILYCPENQKLCYDYRCCANNFFYCKACLKLKHNVSAKVCQASDGTEFLRNGNFEHKCTPLELKEILNSGIKILEKSGLKLDNKEIDDGSKATEKMEESGFNGTLKNEEDSSVFTELSQM